MEDIAFQIDNVSQVHSHRQVQRWYIILVVIVCLVLIIFATHPLWLSALYRFLDVSQSPHPAGVIVVLGGSGGQREIYAAYLYRQGYASKVLISGSNSSIDYSLSLISDGGVRGTDILINGDATTTYDEAEQVLALLQEMNVDSVLVVTDRFHTRRAAATYDHVFQGYDIALTFVSPIDGVSSANWWQQSVVRDQVCWEYLKMLYYWLNYGVWSW